ncbi:MAG: 16S rRNA (cytidine(1402)-2'-O)-methyltransferase [Myxococcales bacterium]|nr:16S rRNA (cytidine(1402)-2'-O)-methyltransferase [Myxococcales bacterium]
MSARLADDGAQPIARRGRLSVIATPIGNLGDLTPRAATLLGEVDLLLCEDTRHTARLLSHIGVRPPCRALHAHNEADRIAAILVQLADGAHVGLVSDAGTPCLSDPGARLVDAVHDAGFAVETLPGPFAAGAGLAASGLTPVPFAFWGFPPKAKAARARWLQDRLTPAPDGGPMSHAVYVPGRDVPALLADLQQIAPDVRVVVARELTKLHEGYIRGTPAVALGLLTAEQARGEAVLLVEVAKPIIGAKALEVDADTEITAAIAAGVDRKPFLRELARRTGKSRRDLYRRWLDIAAARDEG